MSVAHHRNFSETTLAVTLFAGKSWLNLFVSSPGKVKPSSKGTTKNWPAIYCSNYHLNNKKIYKSQYVYFIYRRLDQTSLNMLVVFSLFERDTGAIIDEHHISFASPLRLLPLLALASFVCAAWFLVCWSCLVT